MSLASATTCPTPPLEGLEPARAVNRSAIALVAGNAVYAASQWALVVVIAKLGGVVQVGQFAYALAMTAPIFIFSQLQLRGLQATDASGEFSFAEYLSLRLAATGAALGLVVIVAWMLTEAGSQRTVVLALALAKAIESVADIAHGRLQQLEQLETIAASFASRGVGGLVAFSLVFAARHDLSWAVAAMTAWWALSYAVIDWRALRGSGVVLDGAQLAPVMRLALFAAPMGIVMALASLNIQIPRYVIEDALGSGALGIFAGLAAIPLVGTIVVNALCQAASARLARAFHQRERAAFGRSVGQLLTVSLAIGVALAVGVILLGDVLVSALYSPEYLGHGSVLLALVAWGTCSDAAAVLGTAVTSARQIRMQVPVLVGSTVVTAVAALTLVPPFGLTGAAMAASLGALVQTAWFAVALRWLLRLHR